MDVRLRRLGRSMPRKGRKLGRLKRTRVSHHCEEKKDQDTAGKDVVVSVGRQIRAVERIDKITEKWGLVLKEANNWNDASWEPWVRRQRETHV